MDRESEKPVVSYEDGRLFMFIEGKGLVDAVKGELDSELCNYY